MATEACDVAVVGAGIVGIAVADQVKLMAPSLDVVLIDFGPPMAFTSAQSGENYRNWWPHPIMKRFTDRSIDLMEALDTATGGRINMSRRGYLLATRQTDADALLMELAAGYGDDAGTAIRHHTTPSAYNPPHAADWRSAPDGVDVLQGRGLVQDLFPWLADEVCTIVHIRRAGAVDSQQMGQAMLERFRGAGGRRVQAKVVGIDAGPGFALSFAGGNVLQARRVVNAAGPFVNEVAGMLGTQLPVRNVLQQKIAFQDTAGAVPRTAPFTIDLDGQQIDWDDEDRQLLAGDPDHAWLAGDMPGAIHCRPDGGDAGTWVKLGWAYNDRAGKPDLEPVLDDNFPEIVVRGAGRLNPALKVYYGRLPRARTHYGGYYTMTEENWPLIGPTDVPGSFVAGAMSGFGTMAACAAGELAALWVLGGETMPDDAPALAPARHQDAALMDEILGLASRGVL